MVTHRKIVSGLSIIALLFYILGCIDLFVFYNYDNINNTFYLITQPLNIIFITVRLLYIAPCAIFILYIKKYHAKGKATFIILSVFVLKTLTAVYETTINSINGSNNYFTIIEYVSVLLVYILGIIGCYNHFYRKKIIKIAFKILLIYSIISLIDYFSYIHNFVKDRTLYIFTYFFNIVASISFAYALLIFAYTNTIPHIIKGLNTEIGAERFDPEKELRLLKKKFELGTISEEEYLSQRSEIIKKI